MNNRDTFRAAYLEKLTEAHAKHPEEYFYAAKQIPIVVDMMILSLVTGGANIGPAVKATCRKVGIKATYGAIKAYLTE
jgi:hypothetical protein